MESVPVAPDQTNPVIRGMRTEDISQTEGTVTYDVRFYAYAPGTDELIRLIVNVEAQQRYNAGYPLLKRAIYYCSRMISAQYGTELQRPNMVRCARFTAFGSVPHRQNTIRIQSPATA